MSKPGDARLLANAIPHHRSGSDDAIGAASRSGACEALVAGQDFFETAVAEWGSI
jgi:hypothetical protein